jgi:type I restriction enzyme S subunit
MSKGRRSIENKFSDWESVFFNSVGIYVQIINKYLSHKYGHEPLSKHIKIVGGYAFKSTDYRKGGIPIVRISDFSNEKIALDNPVFYDESKALERFLLKKGDIVIALTGGTIGKLGIVQDGLGKLYLNQRVGKFEVLNKNEFDQEYVYWIARSVQSIIKNLAWGAAIPNVSPKEIEEIEFPIPDKATQASIIRFLNDLRSNSINLDRCYFNDEIENVIVYLQKRQVTGKSIEIELTHQLSLVKQLRQAFLREAMQGKLVPQDPKDGHAKDLLAQIKAEKAKLGKKDKPLPPIKPEEIPFEIPEGWVWCRLGEVGQITGGGTPSMANSEYWDGDIPWVSPKDMGDDFIFDSEMKVTAKGIQESSAKLIPKGSLLIVGRSGILKRKIPVAINEMECTVNQDMKVLIPTITEMNRFLQFMFKGLEFILLKDYVKFGMTVHSLKYDEFSLMPIPLPPFKEQSRIVKKLEELISNFQLLEQNVSQNVAETEQLLQQVLREALNS